MAFRSLPRVATILSLLGGTALAQEPGPSTIPGGPKLVEIQGAADKGKPPELSPEEIKTGRMAVMAEHAANFRFKAAEKGFPERLQGDPLFRYDDETRGYIDGTVWRLGATGRPRAIITTELHPNYLGGGPRVVYDALSLNPERFAATSTKFVWNPTGPAVEMKPIPAGPAPAATAALRMSQIKELSRRFTATQDIEETERVLVQLRRLPREIDRYQPTSHDKADGAIFLFVNGRNPGLVLLVETDGTTWSYGVGRLSQPSTLTMKLDDEVVWQQPYANLGSNNPYTAGNTPAVFP